MMRSFTLDGSPLVETVTSFTWRPLMPADLNDTFT